MRANGRNNNGEKQGMKKTRPSRRVLKFAYRGIRWFVWIFFVLVLILLAAMTTLRVHGVPGPLLRMAVRHANAAGIPVEVGSIQLTIDGWRADNVHYYSKHPADIDPVFHAQSVFVIRRPNDEASNGWNLDIEAVDVTVTPSVEWGVKIPEESHARLVDTVKASLGFRPDRIELSNVTLNWLDTQIRMHGSILAAKTKPLPEPKEPAAPERKLETLSPVLVTAQRFQALEEQLKMIHRRGEATVDINFSIDRGDYASSRINFMARFADVAVRDVDFSHVELSGQYLFPMIRLHSAVLYQGLQATRMAGEYNLETGLAEGTLRNSITSNRLILLLPDKARDLLAKAELQFGALPELELEFGPASTKELLNHISGTFSIHEATCKGLEIETLQGQAKWADKRLDLTDLKGSVAGQEHRADEAGSSMIGGPASGEMFWDENTREFGIKGDVGFDPRLLVHPLSQVRIATNILDRFSFKDQPPQFHIEIGAIAKKWSTLHIDVQAVASNVVFQGVGLNSLKLDATYTHLNRKLVLGSFAATKDMQSTQASATVDFLDSTALFDISSSMPPADLEDMVVPHLDLFGNQIKASGNIQMNAQGLFDWKSMQQTDFSARIQADRFETPVGVVEQFKGDVVGKGSVIALKNAQFEPYGGTGTGRFSIAWNPGEPALPYEAGLSFSDIDFRNFITFLLPDDPKDISGKMKGNIHVKADLATHFFATAQGAGSIEIKHGQLADLPVLVGFSKAMRTLFPAFKVFSITGLEGDFVIAEGAVSSKDIFFGGNLISAKGRGNYSPAEGYDAHIEVKLLRNGFFGKIIQFITCPFTKLFELKLEGPLSKPTWKLQNFQ
jgi:hypothetical protein